MEINKTRTCCCLGEWPMGDSQLASRIAIEAEELVCDGVDTFLCIGAGRYDEICARAVRDLQQRQKQTVRCLLVAAREDAPRYDPQLYDGVIALGGDPRDPRGLSRRLRYLVDNADYALAHVCMGGTLLASAMDYAEARQLDIHYLTFDFLVDCDASQRMREVKRLLSAAQYILDGNLPE